MLDGFHCEPDQSRQWLDARVLHFGRMLGTYRHIGDVARRLREIDWLPNLSMLTPFVSGYPPNRSPRPLVVVVESPALPFGKFGGGLADALVKIQLSQSEKLQTTVVNVALVSHGTSTKSTSNTSQSRAGHSLSTKRLNSSSRAFGTVARSGKFKPPQ